MSRGILVSVAIGVVCLAGLLIYLGRPSRSSSDTHAVASADARAYVGKLRLSDVGMQATENFMKQQVVEIEGKISNDGDRQLQGIEVYCLFYDVSGREIHREKVPVLPGKGALLRPGETRAFRLPFDNLPDGWNQAMPKMVIAGIKFA